MNTRIFFVVSLVFSSILLISATNPAGSSTFYGFTHKGPEVQNATPIFGGTGSVHTINGNQFLTVTEVRVSGVPVQSFTIWNNNQIRIVKATAPTGPITMVNPYGQTTAGNIILPAGANITINSSVSVRSLTLGAGATVTVAPGFNLVIMH